MFSCIVKADRIRHVNSQHAFFSTCIKNLLLKKELEGLKVNKCFQTHHLSAILKLYLTFALLSTRTSKHRVLRICYNNYKSFGFYFQKASQKLVGTYMVTNLIVVHHSNTWYSYIFINTHNKQLWVSVN